MIYHIGLIEFVTDNMLSKVDVNLKFEVNMINHKIWPPKIKNDKDSICWIFNSSPPSAAYMRQ